MMVLPSSGGYTMPSGLFGGGGSLVCFCDWKNQEAFRFAIELAGFTIRSQVIWDRVGHGMGDLKASFAPQHDVIWFATKGPFSFPNGRPKSILSFPRIAGTKLSHPNEKPVPLLNHIIKFVTAPGATVLDPFMGSGSTGVACKELGRNFIGVEMAKNFFDLAQSRINPERAA